MIRPLAPKITVLINIGRMSETVSCCCAGVNPGASTVLTSGSAKIAARMPKPASTRLIRFNMRLKSSQASRLSVLSQKPAKTGMKALPRAPPAAS